MVVVHVTVGIFYKSQYYSKLQSQFVKKVKERSLLRSFLCIDLYPTVDGSIFPSLRLTFLLFVPIFVMCLFRQSRFFCFSTQKSTQMGCCVVHFVLF